MTGGRLRFSSAACRAAARGSTAASIGTIAGAHGPEPFEKCAPVGLI
jgi:hypothetical protein